MGAYSVKIVIRYAYINFSVFTMYFVYCRYAVYFNLFSTSIQFVHIATTLNKIISLTSKKD